MKDFGMCACARTREYCVMKGCKQGTLRWRYSTEGRDTDDLRRVIDTTRGARPISRWLRPERAVAEAFAMNLDDERSGVVLEITKVGPFHLSMRGTP